MADLYTDIGANQRTGFNFPGGGLTTQPGEFNDPVKELGSGSEILAVYTMTGAEVQDDTIFLSRLQPGLIVDPVRSSVAGNGAGTTCSVKIGDTDTVAGAQVADIDRYSAAIDVKANMSTGTGVSFAGGVALITPIQVTDTGVWLTASLSVLDTPAAGKVLVFRVKLVDNR